MDRSKAYSIVLTDLMKCGLLRGECSPQSDEHFMYGIATVVEQLAYGVSEDIYEMVSDDFIRNLVESEEKGRY